MMENRRYPHIYKNSKTWPIYLAARKKNEFKEQLKEEAYRVILEKNRGQLRELLSQCAYSEKKRVEQVPFKVDPPSEKTFWRNVRAQIIKGKECATEADCEFLLRRIIGRYVEEIVGDFKLETYQFADKFLTYLFNRLYSSWFAGSLFNFYSKRKLLQKKMRLTGYVEHTRQLFDRGTVVLVPTHQSNLDSILVGYFMHLMAGMPAFSYGAGLNLYNFELIGYYMDRLGAYKVDRRKRNAIYHETLFTFLRMSVQDGVNNLFFPAGGRVRDGKIEENLKTGLLSALVQAQKISCIQGSPQKVFVVPVVLNNHFVLEARVLINEYLSKRGREKFSRGKKNRGPNYFAILPYLHRLIAGKSEVVLSFGQPLDALGNPVDESGNSLDSRGNCIDLSSYFMTGGVFKPDFQRESIYTQKLASAIADSYKRYMVVLSSQLVAFAFYVFLKRQKDAGDIFEMINIPKNEWLVPVADLVPMIGRLQKHILTNSPDASLFIHEDLYLPPEELIATGIRRLGQFHVQRPLKLNSDQIIICKDLKLLYYYANRLSGFGFEDLLFS
jgi:glycerol-3-phosphate O-acyltransferase